MDFTSRSEQLDKTDKQFSQLRATSYRYSELQQRSSLGEAYAQTIYNAYFKVHSESNTMKGILLEVVKDELGRWERCPSGRLRSIDL